MNVTSFVPAGQASLLTVLGKQNWLEYNLSPDTPLAKERGVEALKIWVPPPHDTYFRQLAIHDPLKLFNLYCMSKALAGGPKLLRLTGDQCRALEHVNVNVAFNDYQQPFPAVFVEMAFDFRQEVARHFGHPCPRYVLCFHDNRTKCVLLTSFDVSPGVHVHTFLAPRAVYRHLEDAMMVGETGTDIDVTRLCVRIAMNACLMLTHLGVRQHGVANRSAVKKLVKASKHKRQKKAAFAKGKLAGVPTIIGFSQNIKFSFEEAKSPLSSGDGADSTETGSKRPHWRRGFFRNQQIGVGRKESKLVFIAPVFVNKHFFAGDERDTHVTYRGV
jgi:hypothetical protein